MTKNLCKLIKGEAQLVTSNQKLYCQVLPFLDGHLHAKSLRYRFITFRDIDDQRML